MPIEDFFYCEKYLLLAFVEKTDTPLVSIKNVGR